MTSLLVRKKMRGVRWLQAAGSQEYEIGFFLRVRRAHDWQTHTHQSHVRRDLY